MNTATKNDTYGIWVLRIWQEPDSGAWRALVQESQSERRHYFETKAALQLFLNEAVIVNPDKSPR